MSKMKIVYEIKYILIYSKYLYFIFIDISFFTILKCYNLTIQQCS
jgi:hypothetical protein